MTDSNFGGEGVEAKAEKTHTCRAYGDEHYEHGPWTVPVDGDGNFECGSCPHPSHNSQ